VGIKNFFAARDHNKPPQTIITESLHEPQPQQQQKLVFFK
jgi:hypothetical protein